MLHIKRIVFVAFLILIFAVALAYYAEPPRLIAGGRRLVPMVPQQPMPELPLFSVDIESIPAGMTARGTSFPLGRGLWLTARHVANQDCGQIILIVDGANVPAEIKFLDPNADLAILQAPPGPTPPLPIEAAEVKDDQRAFAFGFPGGILGATEGHFMGRARMKLGGRLDGTAPVLTWAEVRRFPDDLDSLSGISGGPMLDEEGNVVGIIVAASVRRGRDYTVAPEILRAAVRELGLRGQRSAAVAARDAVTQPVSLEASVSALSKNARIAQTYCIPPEPTS